MADRIATYSQTAQLISNNMRLQTTYAKTQTQVSSGLVSSSYVDIASDTSRLLSLESDYSRIAQQNDNAQLALDRVNLMYSSLTSIYDQSVDFIGDLSSAMSGLGLSTNDLVSTAQTYMNQLATSLNVQIADRYLFSGSATNTAPVDLNDASWGGQIYVSPGPSTADYDYYQGNDYIQTVEASDGFYVDYGITANNDAFEKILRAYDLVINNGSDNEALQEAITLIEQGFQTIADMNAMLSQDAQVLESQIADNEELMLVVEEQIVDIKEVDVAEASVNLQQLSTQLEASYTVTAAMLNLKLSDYIN